MPKAGHGRGAIAAIGLILLFAGVVGGGVLWVLADREPNKAAESFARAAPGCTTTLTFGEPGEYFVYEELSGVTQPVEGCQPSTLPGRPFTFTVTTANGTEVPRVEDTSMAYDLDVGSATSVARITIEAPGDYRINVLGDDPAIVAAVGGDPEADVEQLRRGAIAAAAGGVVLGLLLLWLAGRRSKRAATFAGPLDPGWGVTERDHARRAAAAVDDGTTWPPATTQVPVNPHAPDERRVAQLERPPSASDTPVVTMPPPPGDPTTADPAGAGSDGAGAAAAEIAGAGAADATTASATADPGPGEDLAASSATTDGATVPPNEPDGGVEPIADETTSGSGSGAPPAATTIDGPAPDVTGADDRDPDEGAPPSASADDARPDEGSPSVDEPPADVPSVWADVEPEPEDEVEVAEPGRQSTADESRTAGVSDRSDDTASPEVWPGAAPVPDDQPSGRDDAGAASSEDDTPPA
jgi:hypothetical protein